MNANEEIEVVTNVEVDREVKADILETETREISITREIDGIDLMNMSAKDVILVIGVVGVQVVTKDTTNQIQTEQIPQQAKLQ